MKKFFIILASWLSFSIIAQPVNYKKLNVPNIGIDGQIKNALGKILGSIEENGTIKNADGEVVATIDAFGTLIEKANDNRFAKCDINGNVYAIKIAKGSFKGWKLSMPEPGVEICLLRDDKKKIVAAVHKHFKQYGGLAIYFLSKKAKKK
jgi:hypothetical protein